MKKSGSKKNRLIIKASILILAASSAITLAILYGGEILAIPGYLLVRNDDLPENFDKVIVLMGDSSGRRAEAAFKIWQKNTNSSLVYMREEPHGFVAMGLAKGRDEVHEQYFLKAGIPPSHLINHKECHTTSTLEEALCLKMTLSTAPEPPKNLVVVTEWYHSSRAGWIFDRIFSSSGTHIYMAPAALSHPTKGVHHWWKDEEMFFSVLEEYMKWIYWLFKSLVTQF